MCVIHLSASLSFLYIDSLGENKFALGIEYIRVNRSNNGFFLFFIFLSLSLALFIHIYFFHFDRCYWTIDSYSDSLVYIYSINSLKAEVADIYIYIYKSVDEQLSLDRYLQEKGKEGSRYCAIIIDQ